MDKKYIYVIIIGIIIAVIVAAILLYLSRTKQQLAVQATLGQSQTVTLSNSNPNQSVTINIPYGDNVTFGINISNAAPNSSYTVALNGSSTTISTDSSGSGSTTLSTGSLTSSTTEQLTISGPGISSTFTLSVDFQVLYNPQLNVVVNANGSSSNYNITNNSNSATSSVSAFSASVGYTLSAAVPNANYSAVQTIYYCTESGCNANPTTSNVTLSTNSSGTASYSQTYNVPSNYTLMRVIFKVTGTGIASALTFNLNISLPISPNAQVVINY